MLGQKATFKGLKSHRVLSVTTEKLNYIKKKKGMKEKDSQKKLYHNGKYIEMNNNQNRTH